MASVKCEHCEYYEEVSGNKGFCNYGKCTTYGDDWSDNKSVDDCKYGE